MRFTAEERQRGQRVDTAVIAEYLRDTGWVEVAHRPGHSADWEFDHPNDTVQLLLPFNRAFGDFGLRMADAVNLIAAVEERPDADVLDTLEALRFVTGAEETFRGVVVQLTVAESGGWAAILTRVGETVSQVTIRLADAEHAVAIAAYRDRLAVRCSGVLARERRAWVLNNPEGVAICPGE